MMRLFLKVAMQKYGSYNDNSNIDRIVLIKQLQLFKLKKNLYHIFF